jgi:hypothetical protein
MFDRPLDLRQIGRDRWITLAPLTFRSVRAGAIVVPAEFVTDLASVPRLPIAYLLAGGRANGPAVIHDWLYQHPDWNDRALADQILFEAMSCDQPELGHLAESWVVRQLMYRAVRVGGWVAWRNHGKRAVALNPEWSSTAWPAAPQAV